MATDDSEPISWQKKIDALLDVVRYMTSFLAAWLRDAVQTYYIWDLHDRMLWNVPHARAAYFDEEGSDDIHEIAKIGNSAHLFRKLEQI